MGHFTKIEYQDDWADEDTKYEDWDNKSKQILQRVKLVSSLNNFKISNLIC